MPDPGRCRPLGRTRRGKGSVNARPGCDAPPGAEFRVPRARWRPRTGGTITAIAPNPGSPAVPCIHVRAGEMAQWMRTPAPWPDPMFPGALAPWLVRNGRHGWACRAREHRCRRRWHARASGKTAEDAHSGCDACRGRNAESLEGSGAPGWGAQLQLGRPQEHGCPLQASRTRKRGKRASGRGHPVSASAAIT